MMPPPATDFSSTCSPSMPARLAGVYAIILLLATAVALFGARWIGPADLYEKDQPKTLAYTADLLLHGRFSLPRDVIYQPATKPPLYNWIAGATIAVTGVWTEWTHKAPSILGTLLAGIATFGMTRRLLCRAGYTAFVPLTAACLATAVWFSFGSDVRHGSVLRLSFLARPDMLQCGLLAVAWWAATAALDADSKRAARGPAIVFWLCATAAALTKGPAVAMVLLYAIAYALCGIKRSTKCLRFFSLRETSGGSDEYESPRVQAVSCPAIGRLWPAIGLPLLVIAVGVWLACAYIQDSQHVRSVLLGAELVERIQNESPEQIRKPVYYSAMWFVTKTLPWGGLAVLALLLWAIMPSLRRLAMPAALYLVVVLVLLSLPAGKRMDYLLPAYPPAAVLLATTAAWIATRRPGTRPSALPALLLALACVLPALAGVRMALLHLRKSPEAINHWSDHAVAFARQVRQGVGEESLLVIVRGKHPLPVLLHRHQGSYLTPSHIQNSTFVILPVQPGMAPILVSEPLPIGFETIEERAIAPLGLYRTAQFAADYQTLTDLQRAVGRWTPAENPYHEPGTVFRDEGP